MTAELPVHVSREGVHSLDVPASFEVEGPFDVVFVNHGQSVHVHLHLDDALAEVAAIEASNHYVEGESSRAVRVHVDRDALPEQPVLGKLKVVSGYGAETRWIDVELSSPGEESSEVRVDESLAEPRARGREPDQGGLLQRPAVPVLGLGALALLVAVLAAYVLGETLVVLGSLVVLAGVLVAVYVLVGG